MPIMYSEIRKSSRLPVAKLMSSSVVRARRKRLDQDVLRADSGPPLIGTSGLCQEPSPAQNRHLRRLLRSGSGGDALTWYWHEGESRS